MRVKNYSILVVAVLALLACNYEFPEEPTPKPEDLGNLNLEKVIAIGDGFVAGVMDGSLYSKGQQHSLAAIVNAQFAVINGQEFLQPDIDSENGYNLYSQQGGGIQGRWVYRFLNNTDETPFRILSSGDPIGAFTGDKNALQDLAMPGLKVMDIDNASLKYDPFFERAFDADGPGIIDQIVAKNPTFVICWLGMNDYLDYAVGGATQEYLLTPIEEFEDNYTELIEALISKTNAQVILPNLISFRDLPYFYMRQYNFIRLSNLDKAFAQATYNDYNVAVRAYNVGKPYNEQRPQISFEDNGATLYPQPLVVIDDDLPDATYPDGSPLEKYRQLTEKELALLSVTDEMVEQGWGWRIPLPAQYYLKESAISKLESSINVFNVILFELAEKYPDRITFVDLAQEVKKIADTGKFDSWGQPVSDKTFYEDGVPLEGGLDMNSIFSLDGIHFNQRGNAFLANKILHGINTNYQAKVPLANVNGYIGNVYSY